MESLKLALDIILLLLLISKMAATAYKNFKTKAGMEINHSDKQQIDKNTKTRFDVRSHRPHAAASAHRYIGLLAVIFSLGNLSFTMLTPLRHDPLTAGALASIGLALFGMYIGFNLMIGRHDR